MKFSKLKSWLTVEDAAKRLSASFGEEVSSTDVIQLGLEGRLTLSVRFANIQKARRVRPVPIAEATYDETEDDKGEPLRLYAGPVVRTASGEETILEIGDSCHLKGSFDLPMIGDDRLMVERKYQKLTRGHKVTDAFIDGAFVVAGGEIYQLLPDGKNPLGMPDDATIVVRTSILADFEQGLAHGSKPERHPDMPTSLRALIDAYNHLWKDCDRDDPTTHYKNADVAKWMMERYSISQTMADACAKAIRPEWAAKWRISEG